MGPLLQCGMRGLLGASLLLGTVAVAAAEATNANANEKAASPALQAAMADYRRKLDEYTRIHQKFEDQAAIYWNAIAEKRRTRLAKRHNGQDIVLEDYVLTQPPVYSGPTKPIDPSAVTPPPPEKPYVPVIADFLQSAAEHFKFVPTRPQSEIEFKRAYVKVAAAAGLTRDQIVRVYGFEAGGKGTYDVQAGLEYQRPGAQAISTALGYNQLLHTNSVELLAEQGDHFIKTLKASAEMLAGEPKKALERKIEILRRMVIFCRTVSDTWSEHERLANTPKGLGVHALNLDIDIGPLLQTQKLLDSVVFARMKGLNTPLTAAELEMMNLTGDGNGFDMITMPLAMRDKVPTANFFQPLGLQHNPVAIRYNVVSKLIAVTNSRMDQESKLQGAKDLAAAY
jgi:alkanesulfonate monooxygenase SsuD/methylene tetrahydromethanopterin reductase-like flavin-dependent oxidoreductase (luciferase family)